MYNISWYNNGNKINSSFLKIGFIKDELNNMINYEDKIVIATGFSIKNFFVSIYLNNKLVEHLVFSIDEYTNNLDNIVDKILNLPFFKNLLRKHKIKKLCVAN